MAELALRLRVFIASPGDVWTERDIVENEVRALQDVAGRNGLLVLPRRWEKPHPFHGNPQGRANEEVARAELTVAIFWSTVGTAADGAETGSMQELRIAGEQVSRGSSDDLMVYFRRSPPPRTATAAGVAAVACLKARIVSDGLLHFKEYDDEDRFRALLRGDLAEWLERWKRVPPICTFALHRSAPALPRNEPLGENRASAAIAAFDVRRDPATADAVAALAIRMYQERGPDALRNGFTLADVGVSVERLSPMLVRMSQSTPNLLDMLQVYRLASRPIAVDAQEVLRFSCPEWFYFFCAWGLIDVIVERRAGALERIPYVNPVHQYLKGMTQIRGSDLVPGLLALLTSEGGITNGKPIARNFAAYVLGMIGARDAAEALASALRHDDGEGVKRYCITSLGKLRSRRFLPLVLDAYEQAMDDEARLCAAQAVCRITDIARFEL